MKKYSCLLLPFLFFGCQKKDIIKVDPVTVQHFSFKPGTYWIYKDSLTGKEDSFRVTQNTPHSIQSDGTEFNSTYINVYGDSAEVAAGIYLHKTRVEFQLIGIDLTSAFDYPYTSAATIFPTFSVNGTKYDSVVYVSNIGTFYAKADVGVLKMTVNKGSVARVWELQRYKIVM